VSFSILILTRNEEVNLPACLESVAWCDDVIVLDSYSLDLTCNIARTWGARVFQREFDNFGNQRNHALDEIEFKYEWVFHLDADERFNAELRSECQRVIEEDIHSGYFIPNRILFLGKWIRHCTRYPYPQVRLIKRGEIRFLASGHGQRECDARRGVGHIHVPYDHYNFSKGLEDWLAKHNRYSTEEARLLVHEPARPLKECIARDAMVRRRALKSRFIRLPFRPQLKFLFLYVVCRGFLDGIPGWSYCRLMAMYEHMTVLKIRENRWRAHNPPSSKEAS